MDWASRMRRILFHLGEDATFTHGTTATTVTGLYLAPYAVLPGGLDAGFAMSEPRFAAMTSDLTSVALADTITRGTVGYTITDIQPDDPAGLTVLALQKAS